jgi:hypothetical protein
MTFERSQDYELIRQIITRPEIYRHVSDDFCPPAAEFKPAEHPAILYMLVRDGDELLGLWIFAPLNGVCCEVHTCLLPCAWGERARRAVIEGTEWIWQNTPWQRIVTNVPRTNRLALKFALQAGLKIYGVNCLSYLKGGKLIDQICLGISKPAEPAIKPAIEQEEFQCQ